MSQKQKSGGLDIFRIIAALLVISIHTSPFSGISENLDFFMTRIVARVAVPFFFMVTGQYILSDFYNYYIVYFSVVHTERGIRT